MPTDPDDLVTHVIGGGGRTFPLAGIDLVVVEGPDRGLRAAVGAGITRLGTSASNHLRLTDRAVSRVHCELRLLEHSVQLVDAGSTNGTFAEGVRIADAELAPGAIFRVGTTAIRLDAAHAPTHVPISAARPLRRAARREPRHAPRVRRARAARGHRHRRPSSTARRAPARSSPPARCTRPRVARAGPFVTVDCGAIAETLIESELFGHVRGAFSGAHAERRGLFEEAHGGTLFLDEIAELPLSLQPKLLRVLEAREVRRVGANTSRPIDVRVLAATHRSLAQSVNEGTFREDLYYRLAVVEVELPPLRARREDLVTIASRFYERFTGTEDPLPGALVAAIQARSWTGNVRELRNFIERSVTLGTATDHPAPTDAPPGAHDSSGASVADAMVPVHLPLKEARVAWMDQFERRYAEALLRRTGGNVTRAAEIAGVHRRTFQRLIASLGGKVAEQALPEDEE